MKTIVFTCFFLALAGHQGLAQCQVDTEVYGQVQTDINRGYEMIPTADGHFVIAGQWNDQAYLMKVDSQGQQLAFRQYGAAIGGQSFFRSLVEAPGGGFVAVGECIHCVVPDDDLSKVVVIRTDADLNLDAGVGVQKLGAATVNGFTTTAGRYAPVVRRNGTGYLLAAGITLGAAINWQDVILTQLSASLVPQWDKLQNAGYYEEPYDMAATPNGFVLSVNHAFVPNSSLLKFDGNGNLLWLETVPNPVRGVTYLPATNEIAATGDLVPADAERQAYVVLFDATDGTAQDTVLFGGALSDEGQDVQVLPNGDLLAAIRTTQPNPFGTYFSSRIYRLKAQPLETLCYYLVPNPDNITHMGVSAVLPLSANGKDFAATGFRGFYNRTFFHTRRACEVSQLSASICSNETYPFNGQALNQSGTYQATFNAVNGCDSVVALHLTVLPTKSSGFSATICSNETYPFNGQNLNQNGAYTATLTAANGCDSVVTLNLSVLPTKASSFSASICSNETFPFNGQNLNQSGTYTATLTAANGCDSVVTLNLSVLPTKASSTSVTICYGETFVFQGQTLSASGTYTATLLASNGCDSVVTLHLTVQSILFADGFVTICQGDTLEIYGQQLTQSGAYSFVFQAVNGCDSLIVGILLTVLPAITTASSASICAGETYVFSGQTLTQAGIYTATFEAANGCDSLVMLTLNVGTVAYGIEQQDNTLSVQAAGATFQWLDCDTNLPVAGATGASFTPAVSGNYAVIISQGDCTVQSTCFAVVVVATEEPGLALAWGIRPNPARATATVQLDAPAARDLAVTVWDLHGRLLRHQRLVTGATALVLELSDFPDGVFLVKITDGAQSATRRLVKTRD